MIAFSCSACQKKLSVKDELAGKKGKCLGCGQALTVPVGVAVLRSSAEPPARPPPLAAQSSGQHKRTQPPQLEGSKAPKPPLASNPDATREPGQLGRGAPGAARVPSENTV